MDSPTRTLRCDDETWRRMRVGAVTAGLSTGKFLGVLLDTWERAQKVSAADEPAYEAVYDPHYVPPSEWDETPVTCRAEWVDPWTEKRRD